MVVHICYRHGMVSATFTSERHGSVLFFQKTLALLGMLLSFQSLRKFMKWKHNTRKCAQSVFRLTSLPLYHRTKTQQVIRLLICHQQGFHWQVSHEDFTGQILRQGSDKINTPLPKSSHRTNLPVTQDNMSPLNPAKLQSKPHL